MKDLTNPRLVEARDAATELGIIVGVITLAGVVMALLDSFVSQINVSTATAVWLFFGAAIAGGFVGSRMRKSAQRSGYRRSEVDG